MNGISQRVVRQCDWIIGHLNTHLYADSLSQRDFLINEGLVSASKISVLGLGSIGGENLKRFNPESSREKSVFTTRKELGTSDQSLVIIFVGRLTKDKGSRGLVTAFQNLQLHHSNIDLALVGPLEPERDPLPDVIMFPILENKD